MIAIFSDTHSTSGHQLRGAALTVAHEADAVLHAGDFTSVAALEAFEDVCSQLYAVHGNADEQAVIDRLPTERVVEVGGITFVVRHLPEGGQTRLTLLGRDRGADVVVSGHTHRPTVVDAGDVLLCNPGSHAQPRGNRPGFAVVDVADGRLTGSIREPAGSTIERFEHELQ